MKKLLIKLCLLACVMLLGGVACTNSVKLVGNEFIIEGKVSGIEDGTVLTLVRIIDNIAIKGSSVIATDTIRDGRFMFKSETVSNADWLTISGIPPSNLTVWAAPKAKIKVKGNRKEAILWEVKSSVPNQKEETRYTEKSRDLISEKIHLLMERMDLMTKRRTATSDDEVLAYTKGIDSIGIMIRSLEEKELFNNVTILEQTNISDVWLNTMFDIVNKLSRASNASNIMVALEQADELRKKAEALYGRMSEEDKNTAIGKIITTMLYPRVITNVGDNFADGNFFDANGNTKHISDYSNSGKYLLLDFWFNACSFCIKALPEMKEISETYADKLTIISISVDADINWKKALTEHDMPWVNILDPKGFAGVTVNYGVDAAPNYVLISPEGKVVDKWAGFGDGYLKQKVGENIN